MLEMKPEDVMRAFDILDKMDFFYGQRAGRELWSKKPFEVQEQDIADFAQDVVFVKNLIVSIVAVLEQWDADLKTYEAMLMSKDAEIERLKKHLDYKCVYGYDGEVMEFCVQGPCPHYNMEKQVRAEAITEFAERLKASLNDVSRWQMHGGEGEYFIIGKSFIDRIAEEMKGAEDE